MKRLAVLFAAAFLLIPFALRAQVPWDPRNGTLQTSPAGTDVIPVWPTGTGHALKMTRTGLYTDIFAALSCTAPLSCSAGAFSLAVPVTVAQGGTGLATAADDTVLVGSGSAYAAKTLPGCTDSGGNHLNYNASTNVFSCGTSGSGGSGTVTSVAATVPSWLAVSGSPVTTSGTLAIAAATGQTSHLVVGTCGSGASVSLCALTGAELPNPSSSTLGGVQSIAAVSNNFMTSISTSGVPAAARPTCANLSDSAASCATDATNASNITSGTLGSSRLPSATTSTQGAAILAPSSDVTAGHVVQASDARLSDPRTPTAHGASAHSGNILPSGANQTLGAAYVDVTETTAPSSPSSGTRRLYVDATSHKLSVRTSGGVINSLEESRGGVSSQLVYKSSSEAKSGTTVADDSVLVTAVVPGIYQVSVYLRVSNSGGHGFRVQLGGTAVGGGSWEWTANAYDDDTYTDPAVNGNFPTYIEPMVINGSESYVVKAIGVVSFSAGGTFAVQWGQAVSGGTTTVLLGTLHLLQQ